MNSPSSCSFFSSCPLETQQVVQYSNINKSAAGREQVVKNWSSCDLKCNTNSNEGAEPPLDFDMIRDIQSREILHWNYRNLATLPRELFTAQFGEHVREFYLKRNCLERLPPDIRLMSSLTNLYLSGNQLTELPAELGELTNLRVLDCSQNQISTVSPQLGALKCLDVLILTDNLIQKLPPELGSCSSLSLLELSSNSLHGIPEALIEGLCDSLEELGMDRNPIAFLPRNVSQLKRLHYLSCCHCDLRYLPAFPLYLIESNWRQQRLRADNYHPWKSGTEFGNTGPKIHFHFDGNPKLNHLPLWVLQVWGFDLESFGCATEAAAWNHTSKSNAWKRIWVRNSGKLVSITFDADIETVHLRHAQPLTLLESCLRASTLMSPAVKHSTINSSNGCSRLYPTAQSSSDSQNWLQIGDQQIHILCGPTPAIHDLPLHLRRILALGPCAQCFYCKKPIYIETWVLPFQICHEDNVNMPATRIPYSTFVFCTVNCMDIFCNETMRPDSFIDLEIAALARFKLKLLENA